MTYWTCSNLKQLLAHGGQEVSVETVALTGPAGCGKTFASTRKLACEWAEGNCLPDISLLFVIPVRGHIFSALTFTSRLISQASAVSQFVSVCAWSHLLGAVVFQLSILLRRDRPQACTYDQLWDTNIPDVRHDAAITDRLPMRRR